MKDTNAKMDVSLQAVERTAKDKSVLKCVQQTTVDKIVMVSAYNVLFSVIPHILHVMRNLNLL